MSQRMWFVIVALAIVELDDGIALNLLLQTECYHGSFAVFLVAHHRADIECIDRRHYHAIDSKLALFVQQWQYRMQSGGAPYEDWGSGWLARYSTIKEMGPLHCMDL